MEVILLRSAHKFLINLGKRAQTRVHREIKLLLNEGENLRLPHCKKITNRLFELRMPGEQNIRLFYTFTRGVIIIVSGYIKKSQKLDAGEIRKALNIINAFD